MMKNNNHTSYSVSPCWRWESAYFLPFSHHLLPLRENHDTFKTFSKNH